METDSELFFYCCACKNIEDLTEISQEYIDWYNNLRISRKTKSMSPVKYREHALAA
ncbi:IS3 family transposase [Companilactobacillus sp. HBUAS59699]|uniref:IS3 family transposase n=1 Tax=Companilactobacillus sp. HBUAS59699 TaxID=3109358 RepID=UPI003FA52B6B